MDNYHEWIEREAELHRREQDEERRARFREVTNEDEERCRYCGGDCPNDEDNACDGYSGDIDGLYTDWDHQEVSNE